MENAVTDINWATAKTNALKLFEKQLKIEDSFHAKFLFDTGSALDIYDKLGIFFSNLLKRNLNLTLPKTKANIITFKSSSPSLKTRVLFL